ncbi:MAG TPA: phosphopentomutase [Bryobacteraceae bacterium]|nr:phosphopentomutase [Bryobacteraceae bacterium]
MSQTDRAYERVIWIVLDSVGIGAMPDAASFGDLGSDTLGNIAKKHGLNLPNLTRLGLANIKPLAGLSASARPAGAYGRCCLASPGKDTTTGHWEMAGIILSEAFPVYPHGFPADLMAAFEEKIGRKTLGNKAASGTEIIQELGAEHMRSGFPIVYTSADSVFQIAAHESIIPLEELYRICEIARALLQKPNEVGRVIARPFIGQAGRFTRTPNRHDYAVPPPPGMLLDRLAEHAVPVYAIGKISDVFLGRGISHSVTTKSNDDGMRKTVVAMQEQHQGLIFVNLVDFDQQYGHRNDVDGYATALERVDTWLPSLELKPGDLLIITADHGCDPTTTSTDHSREFVPLLVYGENVIPGVNLGTRQTLADIGQTVAYNFGISLPAGSSFLDDIRKG